VGARLTFRLLAARPDEFVAGAAMHPSFCVTDEPDSPHLSVGALCAELFVAFGAADTLASLEVDKPLRDALARANATVEIYDGADHGFVFPGLPGLPRARRDRVLGADPRPVRAGPGAPPLMAAWKDRRRRRRRRRVRRPGPARARGIEASAEGVDWLLRQHPLHQIVFEATSAKAHAANAPRYAELGIQAVDLTPAHLGPMVSPALYGSEHLRSPNLSMITCGGQATIPVVHTVSRVTPVPYAEIVASIASRSAGAGTRANIDEFTHTTGQAVAEVGGAERGKAIIILNPVEPPMIPPASIIIHAGGSGRAGVDDLG
jgi:hypothetical protein